MRITEPGTIRSASEIKRRPKVGNASSTSFADMLEAVSTDEVPLMSSVSDITATADISAVLTLQSVSEEETARKQLIRKGHDLLDSLETLRRQLLIGAIPLEVLKELSGRLANQRERVSDPTLIALIDDIELRAAVELAKLEKMAEESKGSQNR